MVEVITKQGGMLDKFIGDAIMAAFGLPVSHDDDEDRAVRAAIGMVKALTQWNAERIAAGKLPVTTGIGLNTDDVVSGNIGSPRRMDYTVIGDGVNLAARLEGACKEYAANILISENTYKRLRGTYRAREIDSVLVKGKRQPVAIYESAGLPHAGDFPESDGSGELLEQRPNLLPPARLAPSHPSLHRSRHHQQKRPAPAHVHRTLPLSNEAPAETRSGPGFG